MFNMEMWNSIQWTHVDHDAVNWEDVIRVPTSHQHVGTPNGHYRKQCVILDYYSQRFVSQKKPQLKADAGEPNAEWHNPSH